MHLARHPPSDLNNPFRISWASDLIIFARENECRIGYRDPENVKKNENLC